MLKNSLKTLPKIIELALQEDEVFNDVTSDLTIEKNTNCNFAINAREDLVFCGKKIVEEVFYQLKNSSKFKKTIEYCSTAYILVSNADCIPRPDFIEQHIKNRVEGVFLVGSSILISKNIEEKITKEFIYSSKIFESIWLKKVGLNLFVKRFLITSNGLVAFFLDTISSTEKILKNDNLSFWKSDFEKVTVFDSPLVNSLESSGLISKNIKFRAILLKISN